jgi:hypothetical protein
LNEKFIQSEVFTIHLVAKSSEIAHQPVAYITEHNEKCPQSLPAAPRVIC